jgi:hypothetical protein
MEEKGFCSVKINIDNGRKVTFDDISILKLRVKIVIGKLALKCYSRKMYK